MTDSEPTKEQMVMYTYTDVVPCAGATCSMKKSVTATAATTYSKKPAAETYVQQMQMHLHADVMKADALVLIAVSRCNIPPDSVSGGARYASQQSYKTWSLQQKAARPHTCASCLPGCIASCQTCNKDVTGVSSGACSTIVSEPATHSIPPSKPKRLSLSWRR